MVSETLLQQKSGVAVKGSAEFNMGTVVDLELHKEYFNNGPEDLSYALKMDVWQRIDCTTSTRININHITEEALLQMIDILKNMAQEIKNNPGIDCGTKIRGGGGRIG